MLFPLALGVSASLCNRLTADRPAIPCCWDDLWYGADLSPRDFLTVLQRWRLVGFGLIAYTIAIVGGDLLLFGLTAGTDGWLCAGRLPCGTASNVVTYLARAAWHCRFR